MDEPKQLLLVRAAKGRFTLSLDSSGPLLHKRGYRAGEPEAPIRGTLAAGILLEAGYDGSASLVDPMAGSGTFGIEGAWIARGIGPGSLRKSGGFAFARWPSFRPATWRHIQKQARERQLDGAPHPIVCRESDEAALELCREGSRRAGVETDVRVENADFFATRPPEGPEPGLVVMNPPYGRRLDKDSPSKPWLVKLGRKLLRKWKGWRYALVLPSARWMGYLDLPISKQILLPHGGLKVTVIFGRIPGKGAPPEGNHRKNLEHEGTLRRDL